MYDEINLTIFTNSNCNLECKYCYEQTRKKENDFDYIKKFIDIKLNKYIDKDKIYFNIFGGELFLYIDLLEKIFEYGLSLTKKLNIIDKISFKCSTNGTLIYKNKEVQNFLLKWNKILDKKLDIRISLDGGQHITDDNRIYKNEKNRSVYNDIIKSVNWLLENNINLTKFATTYNHSCLKFNYAEDIINLMKNYPQVIIVSGVTIEEHWTFDEGIKILSQFIKIIDYVYNNNLENDIINNKKLSRRWFLFNDNIKDFSLLSKNKEYHLYCDSCIINYDSCLGYNGNIFGCHHFATMNNEDKFIYENLDNLEVKNTKIIEEYKNHINLFPEECKNCDLFNSCSSCLGIPYNINEDPKEFYNKKHMCGWTYAATLSKYYQKLIHDKKGE